MAEEQPTHETSVILEFLVSSNVRRMGKEEEEEAEAAAAENRPAQHWQNHLKQHHTSARAEERETSPHSLLTTIAILILFMVQEAML